MKRTRCYGRSTIKNLASSALVAGSLLRVRFSDLLANGQAVGRAGGAVVFVWGPLPGEVAKVRITLVKPRYAVGEVVEQETHSELRTQPFCSVFGVCGGCQVQHLAYPAQLAWKEQIVRNALRRIGGIENVEVRHPVGMRFPRGYRNKMSLVVDERAGHASFGFYRARSHAIVPIASCPIVSPQLDADIAKLADAAAQPETAPAFAGVRHAIMRVGTATQQSILSLTTERQSATIPRAAPALARRLPGVVGISNSFELRNANSVMGRKIVHAHGGREIEEAIEGVRFRVSAASFFQVNSEMVGKIFRFMAPGLTTARTIVDLYCGAGTFSLFFALQGSRVVGIEENPAAVREAQANAERNGVADRATFIAARVEGALGGAEGREALAAADIVFLDPPRKGSDDATLDGIAASGVANVWYLSCNPATLARDLARLRKNGYEIGVVQPFDMFPQTGHVETLVTMHRTGKSPVTLPEAEASPWSESLPQWPSDERFAENEYPDFVERP